MSGFDARRLGRLRDVMAGHVVQDNVAGVAWLADFGDDVEVGVAGSLNRGEPEPVRRDSIFRIASMTKPIVAVGALLLVEECTLRLEDPVDALLPELAERRVLVEGRTPVSAASTTPPTGRWATPPLFPSGGGGLVSTVDDLHAFGRMLLAGGRLPDGSPLLSSASVEAMTTDHIGAERGSPGPSPEGSQGWGFCVGVQVLRRGLGPTIGSYGWAGGLGSSWGNDPNKDLVGVVLTADMFVSAFPPPAVIQDFWTRTYAAIDD